MSVNKQFQTFDVSQEAREAIEHRAAKRKVLRESYLKQIHNPVKQQLVMDDAINRYRVVRHFHEQFGKVTLRSVLVGWGITTTIMVTYTLVGKRIKDAELHELATGQVSYADRKFKFSV